jgi:hypothetical protein
VRDLVDLVALRELRAIVADAIARAGQIDSLRHPDRRWSTEDLLDVLQEQLANVNDEADRIRRGPLVIEEAAG